VESINTEGFNSFLTGGRFEPSESQRRVEEEENEEPAMTQLNYEDPDAVKMREELFNHAGKVSNKKKSANQGVVVGEVRELEDVGWGTGRRTRNAVKDSEDEL
jgi:DNA replication regulator DPB11